MKKISLLILCFFLLFIESSGQRAYPPQITGAKEITYKSIDSVNLNLWVFTPENHKTTDSRPAIVFFFGGGWTGGSPEQFVPHCEYLSRRGMVAMVADYRVKSRHNVPAMKCVADAKSAIRYIRAHAEDLGIDSNRIVASGGSAGGHLAAACATLSRFDEEDENKSVSFIPNALVLFNPVLVLAPIDGVEDNQMSKVKAFEKRLGTNPVDISPYHNIDHTMPPAIIFHGTDDQTVRFSTIKLFSEKVHEYDRKCTVVAYEGEPHGFFNYGRSANALFVDTVHKMDEFLVSLGYLKGPPKSFILMK